MSGERIETAGEYTPTTNEVRWYFANRDNGFETHEWSDEHAAMFDRWLSQVTAQAEARGAREALVAEAAWWENIADDPGADSTFTEAQYAGIVAKDIRTRLTQTGGTHD